MKINAFLGIRKQHNGVFLKKLSEYQFQPSQQGI